MSNNVDIEQNYYGLDGLGRYIVVLNKESSLRYKIGTHDCGRKQMYLCDVDVTWHSFKTVPLHEAVEAIFKKTKFSKKDSQHLVYMFFNKIECQK